MRPSFAHTQIPDTPAVAGIGYQRLGKTRLRHAKAARQFRYGGSVHLSRCARKPPPGTEEQQHNRETQPVGQPFCFDQGTVRQGQIPDPVVNRAAHAVQGRASVTAITPGPSRCLSVKRSMTGHLLYVRRLWHRHEKTDKAALANVGYARVSTLDQDLSLQLDALAAAGCGKVFEDHASGACGPASGARLCAGRRGARRLEAGPARRSLPHLIETITALSKRGVGFRSLTEAIDTTTPGGRLVFHIFGAIGQFERDLIQERTRAGLAAAAARGRKSGRKPVITDEKLKHARGMIGKGMTVREIAARLKVGKPHSTRRSGQNQLSRSLSDNREIAKVAARDTTVGLGPTSVNIRRCGRICTILCRRGVFDQ